MSSDIQNVPSLPNQTSIIELKNQSSSSVDGRVKKYAIKEITIEQVHLLKVELKNLALEKPSWYEYLFVHNPSLAHNREKYNLLRKEYLLLNNNYCRQEIRKGKGCDGYFGEEHVKIEIMCGKIRKIFLGICEHPRFDQFIMICILVNCVFLALSDPTVDVEPQYQLVAGYIFLAIFTVECMCKLIALSTLYFDDYWNWLDVIVVIEGWVSFFTAGGGFLSGLKTLRILRPLRVANRLPALKKVITALLGSLPAIFNTFVVFFFFLLIFALLCVMLWNGTFHYRCNDDITKEWVDEDLLCYPAQVKADVVFCRSLQFLDSPYTCQQGETCLDYGATPEDGNLNFDNLGYSLLTLFTVSTMEGWADVLFYTQNVMTQGTFYVFLIIILIGNFTIVNLMIAAILVQLDGAAEIEERELVAAELAAAEEEEHALLEAREFRNQALKSAELDLANKIQNGEKDGKNSNTPSSSKMVSKVPTTPEAIDMLTIKKKGRTSLFIDKLFYYIWNTLCLKFCYSGLSKKKGVDHWETKLRWIFLEDASPFSYFIQGCILFNLLVLAMDSHGISNATYQFLNRANLTLTGIFCFEMLAKIYVGGIPGYVSSKWNLFDGFIVIGSVLELAMASGASSLGALRVVRMLRLTRVARLARLANKWKSLQGVLSLMAKSSSGMGPVLLLLLLFMFIFSILAMQMFGASVTTDDYIRFDSFLVAFVQCFFVIIGEAWVQIMYVTMADTNPLSSIYFVLLIVIGSFILINLILAVVLGDSMPNKIQMEVGMKQIDIILKGFSLRCAMNKWKWFTKGYITQDAMVSCLKKWRLSRLKHGNKIYSLGSQIGIGPHLIKEIKYYIDLPDPPMQEPLVVYEPTMDSERNKIIRRSSERLIKAVLPKKLSFNGVSPSRSGSSSRRSSGCSNDIPTNSPISQSIDRGTLMNFPLNNSFLEENNQHKNIENIENNEIHGGGPGVEMSDMHCLSFNIDPDSLTEEKNNLSLKTTPLQENSNEEGGGEEEDDDDDEYEEDLDYDETTWDAIERAIDCIENLINVLKSHTSINLDAPVAGGMGEEKEMGGAGGDGTMVVGSREDIEELRIGPGIINDFKEEIYELFSNCTNGFTLRQKIELGLISVQSGNEIRSIMCGSKDEYTDEVEDVEKKENIRRSMSGNLVSGGLAPDSTSKRRGSNSTGNLTASAPRRGSINNSSGDKLTASAPRRGSNSTGNLTASAPRRGSLLSPLKKQPSFLETQTMLESQMSPTGDGPNRRRRPSLDVLSPPVPRTAYDARNALMLWKAKSQVSMKESDLNQELKEEDELKEEEEEGDGKVPPKLRKLSILSPAVEQVDGAKQSLKELELEKQHNHEKRLSQSRRKSNQSNHVENKDASNNAIPRNSALADRYKHLSLLDEIVIIESKYEQRWREYRIFCKKLASRTEWKDMILLAIIISSCLMLFMDENTPYLSFWFILDMICALIFIIEVLIMIGATESKRPKTSKHHMRRTGLFVYLEDPWNRLDVSIVVVTLLGPVFAETQIRWAYGICTVVRSFRPLRIINRVDSLKYTVQTLYMSLVRLGTLILFLTFSMTAYAVVGMQLLKGLYYYCEDSDNLDNNPEYLATVGSFPEHSYRYGVKYGMSEYYTHRPCEGSFINMNGTHLEALGKWRNPTFHFDDFANSFLSVFVLSTEGWAEIVWYGLSATEIDYSSKPYYNDNLLVLFYFFFGVAFFGLYMLNLFIGVVFDQYNEMKAIKDDGKVLKKEEREWEEYRERLVFVKPIRKLPNPKAKWRVSCENVARSPMFNRIVLSTIGLNAVTLAVTHRGQSPGFTSVLEWSNVCFAFVFLVEFIMKICGHGIKNYIANSVDDFDAVVTLVSIVDSLLFVTKSCTQSDSAFLRCVRSMRVFRLMRLVNLIPGCEDILLACKFALPRLVNVCLLLSILVFFFANVGVVFFRNIDNTYSGTYASFEDVASAMQLLFVIMTGDAWTDFLGDMLEERPDIKVQIVVFFLIYLVVQYFVVVNLFVMVVCEAFEVLSEDNRKRVEKLLPRFQECWAKLDPHATGKIKATEVESLIRLVPDPFGVSYPDKISHYQKSYRKLRAKADFLRMQQLGHTGGDIKADETVNFTGVLSGIIAVWLNEVGEIKMKGVQEQVQLLAASFLITARAKAWADRTRQHLFQQKVAKMRGIDLEKLPPNAHNLLSTITQQGSIKQSLQQLKMNTFVKFPKGSKTSPLTEKKETSSVPGMFFGRNKMKITPDETNAKTLDSNKSFEKSPKSLSSPISLSSPTTSLDSIAKGKLDFSSIKKNEQQINGGHDSILLSKLSSSSSKNGLNILNDLTPPLTPNRPHGTPPGSVDLDLNKAQGLEKSLNKSQSSSSVASSSSPQYQDNGGNMKRNGSNLISLNDLKLTNGKADVKNMTTDMDGNVRTQFNESNLPSGWVIKMSKLYHTKFYFHAQSNMSSWYHPLDPRFNTRTKQGNN